MSRSEWSAKGADAGVAMKPFNGRRDREQRTKSVPLVKGRRSLRRNCKGRIYVHWRQGARSVHDSGIVWAEFQFRERS